MFAVETNNFKKLTLMIVDHKVFSSSFILREFRKTKLHFVQLCDMSFRQHINVIIIVSCNATDCMDPS